MKPETLLVDDNPREAEPARLAFREHGYVVKPVDFEHFKDVARSLCDHWLGLNEVPLAD